MFVSIKCKIDRCCFFSCSYRNYIDKNNVNNKIILKIECMIRMFVQLLDCLNLEKNFASTSRISAIPDLF